MKRHCLDLAAWRAAEKDDVLEYIDRDRSKSRKSRRKSLVLRSRLRPVDVYAYLRVRFGRPNGYQNFARSDSSDNWMHWDFLLKSGDEDIYIAGAGREVRVHLSENLTDEQWKEFILSLKLDFARIGPAKKKMLNSFEKFVVFQNKYRVLADACSHMHEAIVDAPPFRRPQSKIRLKRQIKAINAEASTIGKRAAELYGNCLKLRLLTPIMAEAFINMLILAFCKEDIRNDAKAYDDFLRQNVPVRLDLLFTHCDGFESSVDNKSQVYRKFLRVINKRNDNLHGNVDPIKERLDVVYFEGKRPLFSDSSEGLSRDLENIEKLFAPKEVVQDYEDTHEFLHELTCLLGYEQREWFDYVVGDLYPGYEVHQKRITSILPETTYFAMFPNERYDDELKVAW